MNLFAVKAECSAGLSNNLLSLGQNQAIVAIDCSLYSIRMKAGCCFICVQLIEKKLYFVFHSGSDCQHSHKRLCSPQTIYFQNKTLHIILDQDKCFKIKNRFVLLHFYFLSKIQSRDNKSIFVLSILLHFLKHFYL